MKLSYDEISPITGDMSVLFEEDESGHWTKICMESGYTTQYGWINGELETAAFEFVCLPHVRETRTVIAGQVWYKITLSSGDIMLYPDVYDGDSMWFVGKWIKLEDDETIDNRFIQVRKIDNKDVPYIVDSDHAEIFEETAFADAYDYFNKLVNEQHNN